MKQLCLSAVIDLPDDVFDAAEACQRAGPPWLKLLQNLSEADIKHEAKCEVIEVRAKAPRKPKAAKPKLVAPPPEAA